MAIIILMERKKVDYVMGYVINFTRERKKKEKERKEKFGGWSVLEHR